MYRHVMLASCICREATQPVIFPTIEDDEVRENPDLRFTDLKANLVIPLKVVT